MILQKLMKSLSETEHEKLRKELHLSPRSEKLLARFRMPGPEPTTKELCEEFALTRSNLYRLCSEIADACVQVLATEGKFPKLEFYLRKFFAGLFVAELARTEKRLLLAGDQEQLEHLYEYAFDSLVGFPVSEIDPDLLNAYGLKWHRAKRNPPVDDDLAIEMRVIYVRICALPSRKKMTVDRMFQIARALLDTVAHRASVTPHPMARYYYYQSEWITANYDNVVGEGRAQWLEQSRELIATHESSFPPESLEVAELKLAYERAMYCGEIKKGYERFQKYYRGQIPDTSRNALVLLWYVRVSFVARQFETARSLLDVFEAHPFTKMTVGIHQPCLLLRAALNLVQSNLSEAEESIRICRRYNVDEDYFLSYEVDLRALETVAAFKREDYQLTEQLIARDMKWLHSRRYALAQGPWPYFYKTLRACIEFKLVNKPSRPLLRKQFQEFRTLSPIYALLLEPEVDQLFRMRR